MVFQDEVHFSQRTTVTRKWVKKGSRPKVCTSVKKDRVSYSGFLVQDTGELYVTKPAWFTCETVIESLREFIRSFKRPADKKVYLVLDGAPWHRKALRLIQKDKLPEYEDIRQALTLMTLPPYSPDLNPIEQVWRTTRREVTHNYYFADIVCLETKLDNYFFEYSKPNEKFFTLGNFIFS